VSNSQVVNQTDLFSCSTVAACRAGVAKYPAPAPFHPEKPYPEYKFAKTGEANGVYDSVRQLFQLLKLDAARFGTAEWNPLGEIVRPGDKVVLKPNLIWHAHRYRHDEWEQVVTHGSIVRAVADYVLLALKGRGEIWIADGPQLDADWKQILSRTGVGSVCDWLNSQGRVPVRLLDLRDEWEDVRGEVLYGTTKLDGDPAGSVEVNLGSASRFVGHRGAGKYYGATYDRQETNYHHSDGRHEYRLSRTVASADVLINLPKMKTHKKTGVTLCLKNLVGVNTGRNWLPHHTDGDPASGGDQFPVASVKNTSERKGVRLFEQLTMRHPKVFAPVYRLAKMIARPIWGHTKETIRSGNWHGNDTCWRMVHDINRCLLYSNDGRFPTSGPKRFFAIVDGIIGGDGDGPAAPDAQASGILVAGFNPVAVDCAATRLMGFDPMRVAMLREAFAESDLPLASFGYGAIDVCSNIAGWNRSLDSIEQRDCFDYRTHFAWRGAIEWRDRANSSELQPELVPTH
jgi:uncharacterized protein (DUF362 family)